MAAAFSLATLLFASVISAKLLNLPLTRHRTTAIYNPAANDRARALNAAIDTPAENIGNQLYVASIGVGSPPTNCKLIA
jgi:hypothetical protein